MKIASTKPYFFEEDIQYILDKFREILEGKSFLSQFKYCEEFERKFAEYVGTEYAVTTTNGTAALELMLRALSIKNTDIIVPTNTNVATAFAVIASGNRPVFADCGKDLTVDPKSIREQITDDVKAIFAVHVGGLVSPNTREVLDICKERGIPFLEDAAHAHGSTLDGKKAGSFGVTCAFSFFSTKVMTTGEGGMIVTDDEGLAHRAKILRSTAQIPGTGHDYYSEEVGSNWKMTEVAALLGLTQLSHLEEFIERRNEIAHILDEELEGTHGIEVLRIPKNCRSSFYKYVIFLDKGINKEKLLQRLKTKYNVRLGGSVYDLPLHKQPAFKEFVKCQLPTAEDLCLRHICMSTYYSLTDQEVVYQAVSLKKCLKECT
jgi:perosamine synthetase